MAAAVSIQFNSITNYASAINKSLISISNFNNEFYSYTVENTSPGVRRGRFSLVTGATSTTCPTGRVVHLTGRKLYPNVNPMNTFVEGSPLQTPKFLVSIYDPISFLNGFIDPTSRTFASYDQNLPNFFDLGTQGSGVLPPLGGKGGGGSTSTFKLADPFPSVLLATGNDVNAGDATMGQLRFNDAAGYIRLLSSAIKSNSVILITLLTTNAITSTSLTYRVYLSNQATGTVRINWIDNQSGSSGVGYLNYLILNA